MSTDIAAFEGPTVGELIVRALARHPDRIAFRFGERALSYAETARSIRVLLGLFEARGLKRGDTVVQMARNSPEQWILIAACYIYGLRSVSMQAAVASIDDRIYVVSNSAATLVVLDPEYLDILPALRAACPQVRGWHVHGASADGATDLWAEALSVTPGDLVNRAAAEDIVRIGYTSGTTGRSKGVLLSSRSLAACAQLNLMDDPWPRSAVVLCSEAVAGGFGNSIVPTLNSGGTVVLTRSADPEEFLAAAERHRPTVFLCLPMLLRALLDHPRTASVDWSALELIIFSGASLSREEIERSHRMFGPVLSQIYGQTECPKGIAILKRTDHLAPEVKADSVGTAVSGVRLALLRDDLSPCGTGEIGEICLRGPIAMSGYLNLPDLTREKFAGGWLHTGDLAYADAEGFLFLVDRKEEIIRRDGVAIVPRLVENAIREHLGVASAAVVGVTRPDAERPQIRAFVTAAAGSRLDTAALAAFLAARPDAVVPDRIDVVDALPVNVVGRTDKGRLRRLALENG